MNGIRRETRGQLDVVYVSMDEARGRDLAREYGVYGTPTLLLLDRDGNQVNVLRGSFPETIIERAVSDLLEQDAASARSGE